MGDIFDIEVLGLKGIPEVRPGNLLGELIAKAASNQDVLIIDCDVIVVAQKVVSKSENRLVELDTVDPSGFAKQFASESGKDPRLVEMILRESRSVVRSDPARGILITETKHGFVCANSGIDTSNVPGDDVVLLLPEDPDASAAMIRDQICDSSHAAKPAVIVSDTTGRPWREGQTNIAIGIAGMDAIKDYRGSLDSAGKTLRVTEIAVADELAAAAELVMFKFSEVPVALIRGYEYPRGKDGIGRLIRDRSYDLFR